MYFSYIQSGLFKYPTYFPSESTFLQASRIFLFRSVIIHIYIRNFDRSQLTFPSSAFCFFICLFVLFLLIFFFFLVMFWTFCSVHFTAETLGKLLFKCFDLWSPLNFDFKLLEPREFLLASSCFFILLIMKVSGSNISIFWWITVHTF